MKFQEMEDPAKEGEKDPAPDPKTVRKKNTRVIIVLGILLLVVIAILLFRTKERIEQVTFVYHGFNVQRVDSQDGVFYRVMIRINEGAEPVGVTLRNDPRVLEDIPFDPAVRNALITKQEIFIAINPEENLTSLATVAALEIDKIIDNPFLFNIPVKSAFTQGMDGKNATIRDCSSVNATTGIITLSLGQANQIQETEGCVQLQALTEKDLIRVANRLDLVLLGVVQ